MKKLAEEIKQLKQAKVKLIRQFKEDAEKLRQYKREKEKEVQKLRQNERKQQARRVPSLIELPSKFMNSKGFPYKNPGCKNTPLVWI